MKKKQPSALFASVRKKLALIFFAALLIIPSLSVAGWLKYVHLVDSRKVGETPMLQERAIDANSTGLQPLYEPIVSVTFDDGYESTYKIAYPILQQLGIRTTQYIISGELGNQDYMSPAQIKAMQNTGHDIACHTVTHPDLTTLNTKDLSAQLEGCKKTLTAKFGPIVDFASPYGAANDKTLTAIKQNFRSERNTDGDISNGLSDDDVNVAEYFNPYNIIAVTIRRDTTTAQIKKLLDYGVSRNAWIVLTYHQVDDGDSQFGLDPNQLRAQLKVVSDYPIKIATIRDVMNAVIPQTGDY